MICQFQWISGLENQKIAAFGSSYWKIHSHIGAAEGCDLFCLNDHYLIERLLPKMVMGHQFILEKWH
jgi:hypothetical protein